jgi:hypothetical protein
MPTVPFVQVRTPKLVQMKPGSARVRPDSDQGIPIPGLPFQDTRPYPILGPFIQNVPDLG